MLAAVGGGTTTATTGFWYDDSSFALPASAAEELGGMLTEPELELIKQTSRTELERAFARLSIRVTDDRRAFWRVEVVRSLGARSHLPSSGESVPLGMLGGSGSVAFDLVAYKAIHDAPDGASRQMIIEGIGRRHRPRRGP